MEAGGVEVEGKTRSIEEASASLIQSKAVWAESIQSIVVEAEGPSLIGLRTVLKLGCISAAGGMKQW